MRSDNHMMLKCMVLCVLVMMYSVEEINADIPYNVEQKPGDFTYYNDVGYGACGTQIDARNQDLVAVSYEWWTTPNPNLDPICNACVKVTYNGRSITVPVKDKCPGCKKAHLDLSQTAFKKLAPLDIGHVYGASWSFVKCDGSGGTPKEEKKGDKKDDNNDNGSTGGNIQWGLRLENSPYSIIYVPDAAACKSSCEAEAQCRAMSYFANAGTKKNNCHKFSGNFKRTHDSTFYWASWIR